MMAYSRSATRSSVCGAIGALLSLGLTQSTSLLATARSVCNTPLVLPLDLPQRPLPDAVLSPDRALRVEVR